MPQKRNPISSELVIAAAKLLRDKSSAMLDAAIQDFERATGPWHVEWAVVPEAFLLLSSSLEQATHVLGNLRVDEARMRDNLGLSGGLILAEAVMMAIAPHFGRQRAHEIVYEACARATESRTELVDELLEVPDVVERLGEERIRKLSDPSAYLGSARAMAESVIRGPVRK